MAHYTTPRSLKRRQAHWIDPDWQDLGHESDVVATSV
jgi:hypothetical protein